ncbi:MAG: DUF433 domain-containing protein [Chloroflexi bacterium]|nr:DUF433 domain-containing protein [Chloroflexota bacterium]
MTTAVKAERNLDFDAGLYSPRVAARVARIKYQNFQAWAKANLVRAMKVRVSKRPESTYTYNDLLLMRLIVRLKEQGAKTKQIRVALRTLEMMSGGDKDAWMRATILVDVSSGVVVAFLPEKPEWNPVAASRGPQKMATIFFPDLIRELKDELVPVERFPLVEVDPRILAGAPVVKGTRISTRAVISARESGQDPVKVFPDLTPEQAANAEAYEEFLKAG